MRRRGYTLLEIVVSSVASAGLLAGLATAMGLAARAIDETAIGPAAERDAMRAARIVADDARHASAATAASGTLALVVRDRDGDNQAESLVYDFAGGGVRLVDDGAAGYASVDGARAFGVQTRTREIPATGYAASSTVRFEQVFTVPGVGLIAGRDYKYIAFRVQTFDDRFQVPGLDEDALHKDFKVEQGTARRIVLKNTKGEPGDEIPLLLDVVGGWTVSYTVWDNKTLVQSGVITSVTAGLGTTIPWGIPSEAPWLLGLAAGVDAVADLMQDAMKGPP
ncbi:MAG: hypothetical protein AAF235_10170 [Planctomycetota bacterium]